MNKPLKESNKFITKIKNNVEYKNPFLVSTSVQLVRGANQRYEPTAITLEELRKSNSAKNLSQPLAKLKQQLPNIKAFSTNSKQRCNEGPSKQESDSATYTHLGTVYTDPFSRENRYD